MLLCLKEIDFHVGKLEKEFSFGDKKKENILELPIIQDFNRRFLNILYHVNELKSISINDTLQYSIDLDRFLKQAKKQMDSLEQKAKREQSTIQPLLDKIELLEVEISSIPKSDYSNELEEKLKETKEKLEQEQVGFLRNKEIEKVAFDLHKKLDDMVFILKEEEPELKDFVHNSSLQRFPREMVEEISKHFLAFRDISVFQYLMKDGDSLLHFKENIINSHKTITFGTDTDISLCKIAKSNGVDYVAKKGIFQITHNTFDLTLNFIDQFSFFHTPSSASVSIHSEEEKQFRYIFQRSIPKQNGYLLFNIPHYKIGEFSRQILNNLTIEGLFRLDDEMRNVLFVCRYKKPEVNQKLEVRKAILNYDKLPHYTEMPVYKLDNIGDKDELVLPKTFRALFVDDEDILQAFKGKKSSLATAEEYYRPIEKAVELNSPLQEYKEGHLPAVATIEIVNGIYDTNHLAHILGDEIDFPNIYSTKIVQQDFTEEKEEMYKGKLVTVYSEKKRNIIVAEALTCNGEFIELLKTE